MTTLKVGSIEHPDGGSNTVNFGGTAGIQIPSGTTAQRPSSPSAGYFRYNTTSESTEFYDGVTWINTSLIPSISSISGAIYAGVASTLTISITNATDTISVVFKEGATALETLTNISVSGGTCSVSVPSVVYNQSIGDTINISITNSDGTPSTTSENLTVQGLPTGGTITSSGGYRYHTFLTSQSGVNGFVTPAGFTKSVEYLIVAGGGASTNSDGTSGFGNGGGGAGGLLQSTFTTSASTQYDVVVGAGGAGNSGSGTGSLGSNSSVFSVTALGGGGGGFQSSGSTGNTINGGSGGGGSSSNYPTAISGGSGTSGQGNDGGSYPGGSYGGGGGGGAGGPGANGTAWNGVGAAGGAGKDYSTWATATSTGDSGYYAGGGGGANGSAGPGGAGGGGDGCAHDSLDPTAGEVNTGGGGGGTDWIGTDAVGVAGGSGIVIIRYQV